MPKYLPVEQRSAGSFLGYPQCCIDAFYDWDKRSSYSEFHGTGFIPCKECAKKPYDELLQEIADNRVCKEPFPKGSVLARHEYGSEFSTEYLNYINGSDDHDFT